MSYQLLAVDMDGTLLDSRKEITPENLRAIRDALARGKTVVFSTGRCVGELAQYFPLFPDMRYALCESGACICDVRENRPVFQRSFARGAARQLLALTEGRDVLIQLLVEGEMYLVMDDPSALYERLCRCNMERYYTHFRALQKSVPEPFALLDAHGWRVSKINFFCSTEADCLSLLRAAEALPVTAARGESTAVEYSPEGVSKGDGLRRLCGMLHIPMAETIVVGDSWNDETALRCAGLSAAMGNAEEGIRRLCDVVVADCDHSGVAEVIRRFLLPA